VRRGFTPARDAGAVSVPTRGEVARMYDAIAVEYDRARRRPWPEVVEFARSLPPRSVVADVGCGAGRHATVFAAEGHRVVGVDASSRLLEIARRKLPEETFVRGDLCGLPLRDSRFSAAAAVATIHHLPSERERLAAMREIARVLRPGGTALVTAWSSRQESEEERRGSRPAGPDPRDVWVPWRAGGGEVQRFYHLFEEGELPALILAAGLRVAKYFRSADNYVAVAETHG
jgi:tRNA (uracil-5-)-methyltransferase TRM9